MSYAKRMQISLNGNDRLLFFSYNRLPLAKGYSRVVIGDRGPYVEFDESHIFKLFFKIPKEQEYRIKNGVAYYIEYRSIDESKVMLYFQKRKVAYADYKIGKYYISPFDLRLQCGEQVIH